MYNWNKINKITLYKKRKVYLKKEPHYGGSFLRYIIIF